MAPNPSSPNPPGTWSPAQRGVQRILAPVERFLAIEAASGIVLVIAAFLALALANSPWQSAYADLWHIPIGITFGGFTFERDLHFWINDGLMTVFFFVVGLEIRREIHSGELSTARRAALPLAAALGGMVMPVVIFLALNAGHDSASGWAVPMATDIAFALGVVALLGNRIAPSLRILLLALAVIDDVGAILVIALFYSTGLDASGFTILGAGVTAILVMQMLGVRSSFAYAAPALLVWAGAHIGGIHATLAGVIVGFMTPARAWYGKEGFLNQTEAGVQSLRTENAPEERVPLSQLDKLQIANREAVSPVDRLLHQFHSWVAFGVMPVFAFANAGVPLREMSFDGDGLWVFLGITIGLTIGKPVGILALSWVSAYLGVATLSDRIRWSHISVVGMASGIGFTMALFIAQLAFPPGPLLETAKLAILCGSGLSSGLALLVGYGILKKNPR